MKYLQSILRPKNLKIQSVLWSPDQNIPFKTNRLILMYRLEQFVKPYELSTKTVT